MAQKPLIIAHRGASGEAPENTLAAFRRALELGADLIELDIHLSADGHIVVMHDETVDRTTNGQGTIGEMTLAHLHKLDAGAWFDRRFAGEKVPTLDEVIELVKGTEAGILVEIKNGPYFPEGFEARVVKTIQTHEMRSRVIVQSFDHQAVKRVKELEPSLQTAVLINHRPVDAAYEARQAGAQVVAVNWKYLTRDVVEGAHRQGLRVFVWTVNHAVLLRRMIELGVDGIITDFPK